MSLEFVEIKITDQHTGESLKHFALIAGDVVIADRGYSYAEPIVEAVNQGVDLIVRIRGHQLALYNKDGQRIDLVRELKKRRSESISAFEVRIRCPRSQKEVAGLVYAYRLPEDQAKQARQRCIRNSRKEGRQPKEATLFLAE